MLPSPTSLPKNVAATLSESASIAGLDVFGGSVRRSSSRFCLGIEHGDYNGTDLFGLGTDRFIWIAYKPNALGRTRLWSVNFPDDGVVDFELGAIASAHDVADSWARFPFGVHAVLLREGVQIQTGMDAVVFGNIPGGGMSRSASLALNLTLTVLEVNGIRGLDGMRIVELAQAVENDYIGSPCGNLDQIMIYFAKARNGTYYRPATNSIEHIPLSAAAEDFRLVSLDTGTDRPGLEKSTYKIRREECEKLVALCAEQFGISCLADVRTPELLASIQSAFASSHPNLCRRLKYIYEAQCRFAEMLEAWKSGDVRKLGSIFRLDGYGLRDDYEISGPELEAMCEIARTVDGVLGERVLGGGDKGAAGAIVLADAVDALRGTIERQYPQRFPDQADRFAVHACQAVDGIVAMDGLA